MIERAPKPAAARRLPLSVEPRAEPEAPQVAPSGPEPQDLPARRAKALHAVVADRGPPLPQPKGGPRSALWLAAAVVVAILADGAASVWFQPRRQAPAPVATREAPPPPDPALEQALAPAPGPPEPSPSSSEGPAAVPGPVAITPEPTITALMQSALELETHDPAEAAIAYARAAIRGRARAAYYLGQFYETGTGVEPSPGMARLWYAAAADLPVAQRRLQALSADPSPGAPAAPLPVFHARLSTGGSEMIWRVPGDVVPLRFRVEPFGPDGTPLPVQETTAPGLIVPFSVSTWRVVAIGAGDAESAPSAMVRMAPADE